MTEDISQLEFTLIVPLGACSKEEKESIHICRIEDPDCWIIFAKEKNALKGSMFDVDQ